MPRFDLENLIDAIETRVKADLNARITTINSEKNDTISLKTIDANAYVFQELNGKVLNYNPFIMTAIEDIQSAGIGPDTLKTVTLSCVVILTDTGEDVAIGKRVLRYGRALEECFHANWSAIPHAVNLKIQSLTPVQFTALNSSEIYRAVGVSIQAPIA